MTILPWNSLAWRLVGAGTLLCAPGLLAICMTCRIGCLQLISDITSQRPYGQINTSRAHTSYRSDHP